MPEPTIETDPIAWIREHWMLVAALVAALLVLWVASREPRRHDAGRYVLVKDDVPCERAAEAAGRRWCYVVLDTRTGKLEERVRKLGGRHGD